MRDFQGVKFLIGIFEVRDVDARISDYVHAFVRRVRTRRTDGRTDERTNDVDVDVDGCKVYDGAGASAGVRVERDGASGE